MKQSKITFLTSVGAGLEYYDYIIYSLLASFISQKFFPEQNHVAALFATFLVLALGNIIRPLGGIIFGVFGDRFGRKKVFANTLLWMAGISFLMGLTPTFATWGLIATFIFSILRILQGLVFGAEFPGALTLLSEHIDTKKQGVHFGFMMLVMGLGVSLGSLIIWSLTKILTGPQIASWGFRIPFLLGGSLALFGFYIRKHVPETPKFLAMKKSKEKPSLAIMKKHFWQIFNIIGILLFPSCAVVFKLIFPVYLHDFYHFSWTDIYLAMTIAYIWGSIMMPVFGWVSDYTGKKFLIIAGSLTMIIFCFPIFALLQTESRFAIFAFAVFFQTVTAIMSASYFVLLPQTFQTAIRFTGTALSHNVTHSIAALTPLVVTYIYGIEKNPVYLIWMFILLASLTTISTLFLKVKTENKTPPISNEIAGYIEDTV